MYVHHRILLAFDRTVQYPEYWNVFMYSSLTPLLYMYATVLVRIRCSVCSYLTNACAVPTVVHVPGTAVQYCTYLLRYVSCTFLMWPNSTMYAIDLRPNVPPPLPFPLPYVDKRVLAFIEERRKHGLPLTRATIQSFGHAAKNTVMELTATTDAEKDKLKLWGGRQMGE